jgi:predicted GIY-YIG superfamily endonuclease
VLLSRLQSPRMSLAKAKKKDYRRWYLYILKCCDGSLYTGIARDLQQRLQAHNGGTASRYTRSRLPVSVIYQEHCRGRSSALRKEYAIKQLSRKEKEDYIKLKSGNTEFLI